MTTSTSGRRLERAMLSTMTSKGDLTASGVAAARVKSTGAGGWIIGNPEDYEPSLAMDLVQLTAFLDRTQPTTDGDAFTGNADGRNQAVLSLLPLLSAEIARRGVIDVLRRGVDYDLTHWDLFFGMRPSADPARRFTRNRFSLTPTLRFSKDEQQATIDLCLFVNGLPIVTVQLNEGVDGQSVNDAIERYKDIDVSAEPLFQPGRCIAHFAVDPRQAYVASELAGDTSVFRTFNQGSSDDAGNPPNLFGIATDYLWRHILTRQGVIDIIENYAQVVETKNEGVEAPRRSAIFPRYHQLEVVRSLVADVEEHNVGRRYLMQHADGSGSSYTVSWLVRQLINLQQDGVRIFDAIFVVTDRASVYDRLSSIIRNFSRMSTRIVTDDGAAAQIHEGIEGQVRIILTNIEQFPLILDEIEANQRGRRFGFVIDEAPSVQSEHGSPEVLINRAMFARMPLPNTSSFVFAPAANDTTLEHFGQPYNDHGTIRYRPFHMYSS